MSLKNAVLEIAEQMEKLSKAWFEGDKDADDVDFEIRLLAAQLRGACKAAGESFIESLPKSLGKAMTTEELDCEIKKQAERKKQQEKEHAQMMEKHGTDMIWCEGGPAHSTMVPMSPGMPTGAKTRIMGAIYELKGDGKLWYQEEDTKLQVREAGILVKD